MLFLKSPKNTGLFDPDRNTAIIKGKEIRIAPNLVVSSGDILSIRGEEFVVMKTDPSNFGEFSNRTAQIIQPWDAAAIIQYTDIGPGSKVLESGAGSGALSATILRSIGPNGKLTTVELDRKNIENARNNVSLMHKFENWKLVESSIEDYTTEELYEAIILDIPEPWKSVGTLSKNLVNGGKICCYSPTYNQLERNVASLKRSGYFVLENLELMKRDILVRDTSTRPDNDIIGHTAFMTFAVKLSGRTTRS